MNFFRNFIVVFIIAGILTRITGWILKKRVTKITSAYLSFLIIVIITVPISAITIGWDVAVAEYVVSLLIWLIIDLLRANASRRGSE